jgi:hypothetical protein
MRTKQDVDLIQSLYHDGKSCTDISKITGISRSTIRYIVGETFKIVKGKKYYYKGGSSTKYDLDSTKQILEYLSDKKEAYVELLGLYLGDGHIIENPNKRSFLLRIFNNTLDTNVISKCEEVMQTVYPDNSVTTKPHNMYDTCTIVQCSSMKHPKLFPQHGKGKKHERDIILKEWQQDLINEYPKLFIRGLMWSDGCRYKNGNRLHYNFTNCSKDIINYVSHYLTILGVDHSVGKKKTYGDNTADAWIIQSRVRGTQILEEFVGSKR